VSEAWVTGRRAAGRIGSVVDGKWTIDARIGSGGMATVYAATHRNGHRAALKMLHTQLSRDASMKARFLREGYVANAIAHPGVVAVLDDGIAEDGSAFLVLELLEGETIENRRIARGGALPIDEVLDAAHEALEALAAAHAKDIVHRDVKPDNVFLTNDGRVKLLDFGLARMKTAQAEATKTGVTIGTPEFMPPEQARGGTGDAVDARSDVWGLGATLFTAITGHYVHDASSLHEQLVASATQRARPIRALAPHVPPSVARVIDRALELEKHDRWSTAGEMQKALVEARKGKIGPQPYVADSSTVPMASVLEQNPLAFDKTVAIRAASSPPPPRRETNDPLGGLREFEPRPQLPSVPEVPRGPQASAPSFDEPRATMPSFPSVAPPRSARVVVVIALVLLGLLVVVGAYVLLRGTSLLH
jgi:eukaryotic-like serine/threonine-protein kinase